MLFRAFPPNERAHASAVLTIPTAIAPALGPVLGGWLVDHWGFLCSGGRSDMSARPAYSALIQMPKP
jgi:MFS family permease